MMAGRIQAGVTSVQMIHAVVPYPPFVHYAQDRGCPGRRTDTDGSPATHPAGHGRIS
jgi:hypothetical protein